MKIGSSIPPVSPEHTATNAATKERPEGAGQQPREAAEPSAKVNLSSQAQQITAFKAELERTGDVRMDRVEQLRGAVENGSYNPDLQQVAESLMNYHLIESLYR